MSETRRGKEKSSICILCIAVARGTDYLSLHVRYRSTKSLQYDMRQYYLVYGKFGEQRMRHANRFEPTPARRGRCAILDEDLATTKP